MGNSKSTPQTEKVDVNNLRNLTTVNNNNNNNNNLFKNNKFFNNLVKLKKINQTNFNSKLKYLRCIYLTDFEKNIGILSPNSFYFKNISIKLDSNIYYNNDETDNILKKIFKKKGIIKDYLKNIKISQFSLNKNQMIELENKIINEVKKIKDIFGPVYVLYSKKLVYKGNYLERICKILKEDDEEFYLKLLNELNNKNNSEIIKKSIFSKYKWDGEMDVIILIPNINYSNRLHTNITDLKNANIYMKYLTKSNIDDIEVNSIIKMFPTMEKDSKKYKKYIKNFIKKNNFKRDMNNICLLHGCTSIDSEDIKRLIPYFNEKEKEIKNQAKNKKIYLPQKCLKPYDYHINGYNPERSKTNLDYFINVDYSDIIFELIFAMVMKDCIHKKRNKSEGLIKKWNNYHEKIKNNEELEDDELVYENIIEHLETYVNQCLYDIPSDEKDDEDNDISIKPLKIKKDHYTKWNIDIMVELGIRQNRYPGIQEHIYPLFKLNIDTNKLPWNDFLDIHHGMGENELLDKVKSFNNKYELLIDYEGKVGIKDIERNIYIKWLSKQIIPGNKFKLSLDSNGYLNINSIEQNNIYIRHRFQIVNSIYKNPLSLIVNNNGDIIIYENGFKKINNLNDFKTIENKVNFTLLDIFLRFKESDKSLYDYYNSMNIDNNIDNDNDYDYKYVYKDYLKSKLNKLFLD
jgi:hypothetical protein